jgi:hypothetical protein
VAGDWDGDGDDTVGLVSPEIAWAGIAADVEGGQLDRVERPDGERFVVGDWDGDGDDTFGSVTDGPTLTWRLLNALDQPDEVPVEFPYGPRGTPVAADWDGDGTTTVGVRRR